MKFLIFVQLKKKGLPDDIISEGGEMHVYEHRSGVFCILHDNWVKETSCWKNYILVSAHHPPFDSVHF